MLVDKIFLFWRIPELNSWSDDGDDDFSSGGVEVVAK